MGNFSARCFSDEPEPQNDKQKPQSSNQSITKADVSMQEGNQAQLNQVDIDCNFCQLHYKELIKSEQIKNLQYPREEKVSQRHSFNVDDLKESITFPEPLAILNNDPITQFSSSWYQLTIALPKFLIADEEEIEKLKKEFDRSLIPCLICIKWCTVDFFIIQHNQLAPKNNNQKDSLLYNCYRIFQNIAHMCLSYKELYQKNHRLQDHNHNIKLYIQLYSKYVRQMNAFSNKYEEIFEQVQLLYEKVTGFKDQNNEFPFFKLVGYMMRFWCQIFLTEDIQYILKHSYRNLNIKKDQHLIYSYFVCALDVNLNEFNIHWIGHKEKFIINHKIIDKNYNHLEFLNINFIGKDIGEFCQNVEQLLNDLQLLFPAWYFEFEYECLAVEHKILRLLKQIKAQNESEIKKLKYQQIQKIEVEEVNSFEAILNTADSLNKGSKEDQDSELIALYLQESIQDRLIPTRSKFRTSYSQSQQFSTRKTRTSTDSLITKEKGQQLYEISTINTLKASDQAVQLSKQIIEPKQKEMIVQFNQELKEIQKKMSYREYILEQRAQKLKINDRRNANCDWLDYFSKTRFLKMPQSGQFKNQIKQILQELQYDEFYRRQLEDF